jgi:hypothetical protein
MATIGGSNIATDGLVLALDAANPRSYVTGSTISNLNLYSQNSLNSYNFTGIVSATTGALAPDGSNTAVLMVEDSTITIHRWFAYPATTLLSNTLYTYSIYAKSAGRTKGLWYAEWTSGRIGVNYDLAAGTVSNYQTGTNTLYTSSITNSGNGWYRISFTSQDPASLAGAIYNLRLADDSNAFTYTGNGLSGSYFWGVQVEQNSYMTPYLATSGSIGYRDTLFDLSGNDNRGILINGPTFSSANNGSIVFNSSNQYTVVGNVTLLPTGSSARTISIWFNPNVTTWQNDVNNLFFYGTNSNGQAFGIDFSTYPVMEVYTWGGVGRDTMFSSSFAQTDWSNISVVYNGSTTLSIYENSKNSQNVTISTCNTSNTSVWIGSINPSIQSWYYDGKISNVLIYNRALSSSEVLQNYNAQKSRYNL